MSGFERLWTLDGVENFRDFGGYATRSGRRLHEGLLYRSAHHAMATDADLARIQALNLHTLVDLRRPAERERMPNLRPAACAAKIIDNDMVDEPEDLFQKHLHESDHSVEAMQAYMRDYYRKAPFEPRHIDLYTRYFQVLGDADGPILIHCAAGKDRTGLLAALTHHLVGVSQDDIVADYLLTNNPERFARRAPLFAAYVRDQTGRLPGEEMIYAAMGVEAEYLHIALDVIEAQYGSLDAYLETALGVDERLRERIEGRLVG